MFHLLILSCLAAPQQPADTYFSVAVAEDSHNHVGLNKLFLDFQSAPFGLPDASRGIVVSREVAFGTIVLDGQIGDWDPANTVTLHGLPQDNHPLSEFLDGVPTLLQLNAAWDSANVYFMIQWEDAGHDASVRTGKWIFGDQGNGESGWNAQVQRGAVAGTPSAGAINAAHTLMKSESEDRVFFMFPIVDNEANFTPSGRGCALYCHGNLLQQTSYSNYTGSGVSVMHTNSAPDVADIWHWKAGRTEPSSFADDENLGFAVGIVDGRVADAGTSAFSSNLLSANNPSFMHSSGLAYRGDVLQDVDAVPFAGVPVAGDEIPAWISRLATGSRADVHTAASFNPVTHLWTVELMRARDTGNSDDHSFVGVAATPPSSLLVTNPNPSNGSQIYAANCVACHQADGAGRQSGGFWAFPRVQRASGSMIHSAINNVGMMAGFFGVFSDQQIEDIAAFLQTREYFRPTLVLQNLSGGSVADFVAGGATAGDVVYFVNSLVGAGPTNTPWGFVLDLDVPYSLMGTATVLADGTATLSLPVPVRATGMHVWVQAVVRQGNAFTPSMVVDDYVL